MGELELKKSRKAKRRKIQHIVLGTIAVAGALSVAMVAPNVIGAMAKLGILPNPRDNDIFTSSLTKLRKRGLIKFENGRYRLTNTGEQLLRRWEFAEFKLKKPKRWDGSWRIIIFDIPEKMRKTRDQIRHLLSKAGFVRLQDSVWVYPYDCEDIINLLKIDFRIGKYLLYVIADQIENDKYLKAEFGLTI